MKNSANYTFRTAVHEWLTYPTSSDGRQSDDHGWSYQSIVNKLLDHRSVIIQDVKGESEGLSDAMRQVIRCVPMEYVPKVECPCAPPDGCYWARSKTAIPTPIVLSYVADVRGMDMFTKTAWKDIHRLIHSRIKSKLNRRHYLLREDGSGKTHLYVILPSPEPGTALQIPAFTLAGVFMDPIDVARYPDCNGERSEAVCNPLDVPYFTDRTLRIKIFASLSLEILNARGQAPTDNLNNDVNDRQEQRKPLQ